MISLIKFILSFIIQFIITFIILILLLILLVLLWDNDYVLIFNSLTTKLLKNLK